MSPLTSDLATIGFSTCALKDAPPEREAVMSVKDMLGFCYGMPTSMVRGVTVGVATKRPNSGASSITCLFDSMSDHGL